MMKLLKVDVSGKSLHLSYCDVLAKVYTAVVSTQKKEEYIKELKSLVSMIQDFSKKITQFIGTMSQKIKKQKLILI